MRARCIVGHVAAAGGLRNQGFEFSQCRNCGRDMVRSGRAWRTVPRGFRVAWRLVTPRPAAIDASQLLLDLPPACPALAMPMPVFTPLTAQAMAPTRSRPHRRRAGWLDLAALALRLLTINAADRLRAWRSWRPAPRAVTPLLRFTPA